MSGRATQPLDPTRSVVLRTLLLDAVAARCATLLSTHGVPAILLKGRVLASWLYPDEERDYGDVDLLVDPAQRDHAVEVLGTLGYRHWLAGADRSEYGSNELELIGPTGVCIDLHHVLLGVPDPARCWAVLSRRTERMQVGDRWVTALDPPARTMHLALHVAQNGPVDAKAVRDLQRGLDRVPHPLWHEAAGLARAVDATGAFAAGLRVLPAGQRLARELGLVPPRDVELLLRTRSAPPEALQIQNLLDAGSLRARLHLIARKLWPTTAYMRGHLPAARRGAAALLIARLRRMAGLPAKLTVAARSWCHARRDCRRTVEEMHP